jgi:hypothetical protein
MAERGVPNNKRRQKTIDMLMLPCGEYERAGPVSSALATGTMGALYIRLRKETA